MTTAETADFLAELISQLLHADTLITEQADRIDALEPELARLRRRIPRQTGSLRPRRTAERRK